MEKKVTAKGVTTRGVPAARAAKLKAMKLEERCMELAAFGLSAHKIAERLGCSHVTVLKHLDNGMKLAKQRRAADPNNEKVRAQHLEAIALCKARVLEVLERDHLHISPTGKIAYNDGRPVLDDDPNLRAVNTMLAVLAREAKLVGIDAPTRAELTGADGGPIEIAAVAQEAREHLAAKLQAIERARRESE